MNAIPELLVQSIENVWISLTHNWPFLLVSVVISAGLRLYLDPQKTGAFLTRYRNAGVIGATVAAVATPFCSCGTTAVILGMMASTIPWAPIVAFMVASPLSSPEGLVYSAGLFGWPFAIALFIASILLGLLGGGVAAYCEQRGWLANQARFRSTPAPHAESASQARPAPAPACGCAAKRQGVPQPDRATASGTPRAVMFVSPAVALAAPGASALLVETCGQCAGETSISPVLEPLHPAQSRPAVSLRRWVEEIYRTGRQLLVMFLGFAFLGYFINGLIPAAWVAVVFGGENVYSVPLAAALGLPFYINSEGSLPLVRALIDNGMSQGAALAFLITGAGTSIGALGGALTIARWRVVGIVVGTLWAGSVLLGYLYDLLLAMG